MFQRVTLSALASVRSGHAFKSKDWTDEGIPVVKIHNLKDGSVVLDGCSFVCSEVASSVERHRLSLGDILVSMTGHVGEIARVRARRPMMLNQRVGRFSIADHRRLSSDFLFHALRDPKFAAEMRSHAHGAAQPNISPRAIEELSIWLPPLEAQRKIAAVLGAYDDLIEVNRRRIRVLEEMAQAIYREWFVNFRYPGHEHDELAETEIGLVPRHWLRVPASEAVAINPRVKADPMAERPFASMSDLSENSMLMKFSATRTGNAGSKFVDRDTLFARISPSLENGKTAFVQGLGHGQVASGSTEFIVLRGMQVPPEHVYLLARQDDFRDNAIKSMAGASGRQRVRPECFDSYILPVPPRDVSARFSELVHPFFKLTHALNEMNSALAETRDLSLPRLVSGDLDVSELDIAGVEVSA